jgi:RND family efflux transporter MFP subunit
MAMRTALTVGALAAVLAGCGQSNTYVAPPPPKVTVATPVQQPVTRYLELTGSTAAVNSADLTARVPGFVQEVNYADGATVKKGTLLFTIEPEPYEVKLQQAQAAEAGALASLKQAQTDFDRQAKLVTTQSATQAAYDQALANRDSAQANYAQAQANTKLAALNNEYAHVKAPFDGIGSARQVSVGEFVGATPTVLATIVQADPIYVNFNISEQDVLRIRAEIARRGLTRDDLLKVPVEVGLQSESGYPHAGTFDYAAPIGYFVRVRIPVERQANALLVPDVALGADQSGRYVLVVNKDNVVEQRKVEIGPLQGELRVIDKGLAADDRVVVAGVLRVIPGETVDPQAAAAGTARAQ